MEDGVNANALATGNATGYIDHATFLGTINPDTNKIPKHLFEAYLSIYNNYFKAQWMPDRTEANHNLLNQDDVVPASDLDVHPDKMEVEAGRPVLRAVDHPVRERFTEVPERRLDLVCLLLRQVPQPLRAGDPGEVGDGLRYPDSDPRDGRE